MKKTPIINGFLIVFGIIIGLLIAELGVRVLFPQNRMVTWLEMHPDGFMMNQKSGAAFQEFGKRKVNYRFTDRRLRGTEPTGHNKSILALGDSFTFGLLLNEEDTYVQHLQHKLDTANNEFSTILNGGVGGAGLADWPAWLHAFGNQISPDLILYFLNTDDLDRALSKNLYVLKGDSLIKTQRWQPRQFMFQLGKKPWYRWLQSHSHLANYGVRMLWNNFYFIDLTDSFDQQTSSVPIPADSSLYLTSDYALYLGQSLLYEVQKWCEINNCQLIVTTTGFFNKNQYSNHTTKLYNWLLDNHSDTTSAINFFDNTPCVFDNALGDINSVKIPGDSHPNEIGAEVIANCTWNWFHKEL